MKFFFGTEFLTFYSSGESQMSPPNTVRGLMETVEAAGYPRRLSLLELPVAPFQLPQGKIKLDAEWTGGDGQALGMCVWR